LAVISGENTGGRTLILEVSVISLVGMIRTLPRATRQQTLPPKAENNPRRCVRKAGGRDTHSGLRRLLK
jgi:hypothetical protein